MNDIRSNAIALHGFLGCEKDFKFLDKKFLVFSVNLIPLKISQNQFESFDQLKNRILKSITAKIYSLSDTAEEITFFSYSMGSKFLFSFIDEILKLNTKVRFKFVFLSTHFGLYKDAGSKRLEIKFRENMNNKFLELLENSTKEQFLDQWSRLSLFSNDKMIETNWSLQEITHYFKSMSRSQTQTNIVKIMRRLNALVVYGSEDLKYKDQALGLKMKLKRCEFVDFLELQGRSHRLLEHSDLKEILNCLNRLKSN